MTVECRCRQRIDVQYYEEMLNTPCPCCGLKLAWRRVYN